MGRLVDLEMKRNRRNPAKPATYVSRPERRRRQEQRRWLIGLLVCIAAVTIVVLVRDFLAPQNPPVLGETPTAPASPGR